jgi:hypothetical protein
MAHLSDDETVAKMGHGGFKSRPIRHCGPDSI